MRIVLFLLCLACATSLSAATFMVTTTADGTSPVPAGSLRQAILDANANPGPDNIVFNLPTLPATITVLGTKLPETQGAVTITGPGARQLTINGGGANFHGITVGLFNPRTPSDAVIEDLTITGFWLTGGAGAAFNLTNTTTVAPSSITLNRVAVLDCRNTSSGVVSMGTGTFTATGCEFTSCQGGTGGAFNVSGGMLRLTNCTLSGNQASLTGGAINVTSSGAVTLNSCTISGNTSANAGGGINVAATGASCTLLNTIVAGNTSTTQASEDLAGTGATNFISNGFNLIQVTTGSTFTPQSTDITGVSPQLTAIANNGGPTNTMALASTSPCIDAGTSSSGLLTSDQRGTGFVRTYDDAGATNADDGTDIGAFERQPVANPQISAGGTLSPFATTGASVPSTEQTFTVAGTALTQAIAITPPQHWEVSFTSGGTYTGFPGSISTAAPTGGVVATTTVYIRYNPTGAPPHSDSVVLTSAGATPQPISVTGVLPTISSVGVDFDAHEDPLAASPTATWRLTVSAALTTSVTVNFNIAFLSTPAASTVPGEDFTLTTSASGVVITMVGATGNTVTIPAGLTTVDIVLTATNDNVYEDDENVWFQAVAGTGYNANASNSFIDIHDNDAQPSVMVSATDNTAGEVTPATDTATYTINFSNPSAFVTTLNFSMSGTADSGAGVDYTLSATGGALNYTGPNGTITVPAMTTTLTVTLTVTDDSSVEGTETATLAITSGTGYAAGTPASDTVNIADNDVFPMATVAATDNSASEAAAVTDTAVFVITLSPAPVSATTLNFTMGGLADTAPGVDYDLSATGGTLAYTGPSGTIGVGAGTITVTITLTANNDLVVEGGTAETATFTINTGTGYIVGTPATDSASIVDDDIAVVPTVTVSATDAAASEGTPATNTGEYTITLAPAPNTALTIQFAMSGTADTAPGADYTLAASGGSLTYTGPNGSVTITPGTTSVVVTLTVIDDLLAEGVTPESAQLTLAAGTGYTLGTSVNGTVDITDNDTPIVSVATTDAVAAESAAGTDTGAWTLTLSPAPTNATTLAFSMSGTAALNTGADYTLSVTGGTLTYTTGPTGTIDVTPGITTVTVTLTVFDDSAVEGAAPETAVFTLVAGAGYGLGATVSGVVSIDDNDLLPVSITTTSLPSGQVGSPYNQPIAATGGAAPYAWSVVGGTLPSGLALAPSTTNLTALDGTPTASGLFNFTIEVTDGVTTDTQAFNVTIAGGGSGGGGSGGDGGGGGGGCVISSNSGTLALLAMLLAGLAVATRRRRA